MSPPPPTNNEHHIDHHPHTSESLNRHPTNSPSHPVLHNSLSAHQTDLQHQHHQHQLGSPPAPQNYQSPLPSTSQSIDFDEGVLRTLCTLECGLPLLLDRLKQAVGTSREVGLFLKKKSQLEEEYSSKLAKLSRERLESYNHLGGELKAGSFSRQYVAFLSAHERMALDRAEYSSRLGQIADELGALGKEVDRVRKANKDVGWRLEKNLAESEGLTEKAKAKFDGTAEDLERVLMSKNGEPSGQAKVLGKAISKLTTKGPRSAGQLARLEEDMRVKMSMVSDVYRSQVLATQQIRQEYFNLQLPKILRTLKEHSDEIDLAIQYYLTNYSALSESLIINDALTVSALPVDKSKSISSEDPLSPPGNHLGPAGSIPSGGLRELVQEIDNRSDFKEFMSNYAAHFNQTHHAQLSQNHNSSTGSSLPSLPGTTPIRSQPIHRPSLGGSPRTSVGSTVTSDARRTFGVDLAAQMARDGLDTVPKVIEKCVEAVERAGGIELVGIYRLSGTTSKIGRLKARFDTDIDNVHLAVSEENQSEINDITGVMKLWLRELPEPLLTWKLYGGFIEAGRIENDRLRHIRLHERVNELPDPNYATLKYLMGHLDKVKRNEAVNSMGTSNLAVIFGPTLLSPPPPSLVNLQNVQNTGFMNPHQSSTTPSTSNNNGENVLQDMSAQCKVVETILEHYREIFVDEGEEESGGAEG